MKKLLVTLLLISISLMTASLASAVDVYLKDGSIIKAINVYRAGNRVVVLINRDSITEFNPAELDMKKTFRSIKKPATAEISKTSTNNNSQSEDASADNNSKPEPATSIQPQTSPVQPVAIKQQSNPTASTPETPKQNTPPQITPPAPPRPEPERLSPPTPPVQPTSPFTALSIVPVVVGLAIVVLMLAAFWKVFEKAGEPGWKSLIPVYNAYLFVIISGKPGWWFILFFIPIVGVIANLLVCLSLANKFGKGNLYGVGLFLLGPILYLHLAFSDAEYVG